MTPEIYPETAWWLARQALCTPLVYLLAIVPGLGFAGAAARRIKLSWPEILVVSFAFTMGWVSATATIAHLLGLGLWLVIAGYFVLVPVSAASFVWEWRTGRVVRPPLDGVGLAVGFAGAVVAIVERPWFRGGADTFYHLAATRSLLTSGRPLVTDPFLGTGAPALDPSSGTWHTMQALLSWITRIDIEFLYMGITAFGAGMLMMAFWMVARRVSGSAWAAAAATVAMAVIVFHGDVRALAYPKHLSMALAFAGIELMIRLIDEQDGYLLMAATAVGFATTTMHLGAAELFFLASGFILATVALAHLIWRRAGVSWGRQALIALTLVMLLVAVLSVPVLAPKAGALVGSSVLGEKSFRHLDRDTLWLGELRLLYPGGLASSPRLFWLSVLLAVLLVPQAFRERRAGALAGFALLVLWPTLLTNPLVTPFVLKFSSYMAFRIASLARFMPFIGIAWGLAQLPVRERRWSFGPRAVAAGLAAAAVAFGGWSVAPELRTTFLGEQVSPVNREFDVYSLKRTYEFDIRQLWGEHSIAEVRRIVGHDYPVVASDDLTGYYLAGLAPLAVVAPPRTHSPAYIEVRTGEQRRADMLEFFSREAKESDRRRIVDKYGVRYVAVWKNRVWTVVQRRIHTQDRTFKQVYDSPYLSMYEVVWRPQRGPQHGKPIPLSRPTRAK